MVFYPLENVKISQEIRCFWNNTIVHEYTITWKIGSLVVSPFRFHSSLEGLKRSKIICELGLKRSVPRIERILGQIRSVQKCAFNPSQSHLSESKKQNVLNSNRTSNSKHKTNLLVKIKIDIFKIIIIYFISEEAPF